METITAKNKIEALKKIGLNNIYFKGNTPYGYKHNIYSYEVYAVKMAKNSYYMYEKKIK
jgi:hypothetical protein